MPDNLTLQRACNVLDGLANFQFDLLNVLNKKMAALRRLADILEQLGDLSSLIPDISRLVPISLIDLSMYQSLQQACPFLNLPPVGGANAAILDLQRQVNSAYGHLIGKLNGLPWKRNGKLQGIMDSYQSKLNLAALLPQDYLRCLQQACVTVQQAGQLASEASNLNFKDVGNAVKVYTDNFVDGAGQVLSDTQKEKLGQVDSAITQVKSLMDVSDVKDGLASARLKIALPGQASDVTAKFGTGGVSLNERVRALAAK